MRTPPEKFQRGPKATRDKLNAIIDVLHESRITTGPGIRLRESQNGLLLTLDEKILVGAGLANSENFGSRQGDNGYGAGGDSGGDEENQPVDGEPDPDEWDGSGGTEGGGDSGFSDGGGLGGQSTPPLMWATFVLPDADLEEAYSASLFAVGGTGSYTYAITGGALPPGLTLSGNTISGTPTADGSYSVDITVTSGTQSKPASFFLMVSATGGSVKIIGTSFLGLTYWLDPLTASTTLSVVGGTPPYSVFFTGGSLASWYGATFNGPNVPRPSSMGYFNPNSIYGDGITVTIAPRLTLLSNPNFSTRTREAQFSPNGPRRWTMIAFDSTGSSFTKTIVADFLWDTSRYWLSQQFSFSTTPWKWFDRDSSGNIPANPTHPPFTGTPPFVT